MLKWHGAATLSDGNRFSFDWKDGNSGTVTFTPVDNSSSRKIVSAPFTRLDG